MNLVKFIVFLVVIVAVGAGGYFFVTQKRQSNQIADVKQLCVQKYKGIQQSTITDVEGFCECTAHVDRADGPEQFKAGGKACMDKFGKANLLKSCESMNADMVKEDSANKGVNCECFYDKMLDLFGDQANEQNGADNLTKEQRRATVAEAFLACKRTE